MGISVGHVDERHAVIYINYLRRCLEHLGPDDRILRHRRQHIHQCIHKGFLMQEKNTSMQMNAELQPPRVSHQEERKATHPGD
jgi:hypothetical protein